MKTMADVLSFMRHGWRNIWKQKTIWVFSALSIISPFFRVFVTEPDLNSFWLPTYLAAIVLILILFFISLTGVPYAAYCFSIGKKVDAGETLSAIKKYAWRLLCSNCLVFLVLLPFMCLALVFTLNTSPESSQITVRWIFMLPLALFTGMWDFTMFELFANDRGIQESMKNAWGLFTAHFSTLAILGMIIPIVFRFFDIFSGIFTVLIQSGFDMTALRDINFLNPSASLGTNLLFVFMNGIAQIVITPFISSAFALAYVKYAGVKTSILTKQMQQ
jgi:hypothetical protein